MRRLASLLGVTLSLLLTGSCGSGSPNTVTITLLGNAGLDGWVSSSGTVFSTGTTVDVGDIDGLLLPSPPPLPDGARGFWSFDLAALPPTAMVVTATLTAYQASANAATYASHGVVTLDHLDYGATLDAGDYSVAAIASGFATLSSDAIVGNKSVDVTAAVQLNHAALHPRSQFRARFSLMDSDFDGLPDIAQFTSAESTVEPPPVLTVTYLP